MRIGLHARNDTQFTETDYNAIRVARIETLKMMDFTQAGVLDRLRREQPGIEFIVRLFDDRISGSHTRPSPAEFVARFAPRITALRAYALKYEIHNEPNHYQGIEGWGNSDADAQHFRQWYLAVLAGLRQACPWASFGFPGLALNYPHRDMEWLDICRDAVLASDWLGCHCYWQYGSMFSQDWGLRFVHYRQRFPSKTIEITEFGNSTPGLDRQEMANQYAAYYQRLQQYPYIGSASSFICSSPDPTWDMFAWCNPNSQTLYPVVFAVGNAPRPPIAPAPVYRVAYVSHATPPLLTVGQHAPVTLALRNDGNVLWPAGGTQPVYLGYRWLPQGPEGQRAPLPHNVPAGAGATVDASVQAPSTPGAYVLRWDLFQEGVGWFSERGAAALEIAVQVRGPGLPAHPWAVNASHNAASAALAVDADPATVWTSGQTQEPGMWFAIDLGAVQAVSALTMSSPAKDFPRGYALEVSTDGEAWIEVGRKDPNWRSVEAVFPSTRARRLRVVLTRSPRWPVPWSISDTTVATAPLWSATAEPHGEDAFKSIDNDPQTAWSTKGPQNGGWFQVDFAEKLYIQRIRLDNTSEPQYPRGYIIRTSLDGHVWEEAARRASNWRTVDAAIGPRWARLVRIENTGSSKWHSWTIAEIVITTAAVE